MAKTNIVKSESAPVSTYLSPASRLRDLSDGYDFRIFNIIGSMPTIYAIIRIHCFEQKVKMESPINLYYLYIHHIVYIYIFEL